MGGRKHYASHEEKEGGGGEGVVMLQAQQIHWYWQLHCHGKFSELRGCLESDSNSNLFNNTDDHNIYTDCSVVFHYLGNLCKLTPPTLVMYILTITVSC